MSQFGPNPPQGELGGQREPSNHKSKKRLTGEPLFKPICSAQITTIWWQNLQRKSFNSTHLNLLVCLGGKSIENGRSERRKKQYIL